MKNSEKAYFHPLSQNELLSVYGGDSAWTRFWKAVGSALTSFALAGMPTKTDDYDHWDYYNPNDPLN